MNILSNFSETLSELMLMENLNAGQLSKFVNIERSSITKYLEGKVLPKLPYATAIADYFGCSLDYLFGLSNEYKKCNYLSCPPFYQLFQQLLKSRGCTRYRLYTDLGFHDQVVDNWYYGKHIPTLDYLIAIANYFDCSLDELVGRKIKE